MNTREKKRVDYKKLNNQGYPKEHKDSEPEASVENPPEQVETELENPDLVPPVIQQVYEQNEPFNIIQIAPAIPAGHQIEPTMVASAEIIAEEATIAEETSEI